MTVIWRDKSNDREASVQGQRMLKSMQSEVSAL